MYGHPSLSRAAAHPLHSSGLAVLSFDATLQPESAGLSQLTPDGVFRSRDGRPEKLAGWRMSAAAAERVLARLRARQTPIVVDYEHQTLYAADNGQPAPAAGWIDPASVEYRPGAGLYAPIRWTDRARAFIQAGEYLYLSPVLRTDEVTGDVLELLHVSLVNDPAVDGMAQVVALRARFDTQSNAGGGASASAKPNTEESEVNELLKKLVAVLGLPADANEEAAHSAVVALKARADQVQEVGTALGVAEGQSVTDAVVALKTKAASVPDLSGYVPRAMYEELRGQVVALKANSDTAEIDRLIQEGLEDGRIAGQATADYLRAGGLVALKAHLKDAPGVAALKATQTGGKKPDGSAEDGALSAAERAIAANAGVSEDAFKAARGR